MFRISCRRHTSRTKCASLAKHTSRSACGTLSSKKPNLSGRQIRLFCWRRRRDLRTQLRATRSSAIASKNTYPLKKKASVLHSSYCNAIVRLHSCEATNITKTVGKNLNSTPRGARMQSILCATHYARLRRAAAGAIGAIRACERAPARSGLIICAPLALQAAAQKGISPSPPTQKRHPMGAFALAEKERFELSRRDNRPTPLAGAPLRPLEYFSVYSSQAAVCSRLRHRLLYTIFILLSTPFSSFFQSFFFFLLLTYAR